MRFVALLLVISLNAFAETRFLRCADTLAAEVFATAAHAGQRYGPVAFDVHLRHLQAVLRRFRFDPRRPSDRPVFVVGWLHDVLEDTAFTAEAIDAWFGPDVLRSVRALTLDPALSRRGALLLSMQRMEEDPIAVAAKLADRIANVEVCLGAFYRGDGDCYRDYVGEWTYLRLPFRVLASDRRVRRMWAYLDGLLRG